MTKQTPSPLEALTWIDRHYASQDMNHVDFRVGAKCQAEAALPAAEQQQALIEELVKCLKTFTHGADAESDSTVEMCWEEVAEANTALTRAKEAGYE